MTRIFDALRKARAHGIPPAAPAPPMPMPVLPAARAPLGGPVGLAPSLEPLPARPLLPPPTLLALPSLPPMGDDVLREMGTLRVHLESALPDKNPRTVMLVSSQGGEGTTTVATQLATALARDGAIRVLLMDAHVRRPILTERTRPGAPQRSLFGAKRRTGPEPDPATSERLRVLPVPDEFRGPGGITVPGMRQLLESAQAGFDWIIVDGPPVLESPDSAALAVAVDGVVMVVQAGRTKRPVLTRSVDLLRKAGARVLGTVLNRRRLEIPGFIYRRI